MTKFDTQLCECLLDTQFRYAFHTHETSVIAIKAGERWTIVYLKESHRRENVIEESATNVRWGQMQPKEYHNNTGTGYIENIQARGRF